MSLKVNGQTYGWGDVDVKIPGLVLVVQEISYDDEQEMEESYGKGYRPRGYGKGNYKASGKMSMLRDDYDDVLAYCKAKGIPFYGIEWPSVVVSYANEGERTRIDELKKVIPTKRSHKAAQGDKSLTVDIDLMIVGGINWGLWACSSSTSSAGCWAAARPSGHASCSRWWAWPLSAVSRACLQTRPGSRDKRKRLSCRQEIRHESLFNTYKESRPDVCGNQTYPCGQVGALSPVSRFLIEPSWSTHDGEVCNPPTNSKLPLND